MLKVFIDNREQKRVKTGTAYFTKHGYKPVISELLVGDYCFTDNNINVVFEYKTIEDFINSINDNRVFNQALKQSTEFDYHFVIIVGSENDLKKAKDKLYRNSGLSFNNKQWNGALASLVEFTSVLRAKNENLAFDLMERVALKCVREKPIVHRFPKSKGSPAYRFLVNNVNGVSGKTAEKIVDSLGLWSLYDVLLLDLDKLMSVKGIGRKKAKNILNQILNEYN